MKRYGSITFETLWPLVPSRPVPYPSRLPLTNITSITSNNTTRGGWKSHPGELEIPPKPAFFLTQARPQQSWAPRSGKKMLWDKKCSGTKNKLGQKMFWDNEAGQKFPSVFRPVSPVSPLPALPALPATT